MAEENDILFICDPCLKEHHLQPEPGYQTVRPCDTCRKYREDGENKPTSFVRTTLTYIDMNKVRREFGYTELGPLVEEEMECKDANSKSDNNQ